MANKVNRKKENYWQDQNLRNCMNWFLFEQFRTKAARARREAKSIRPV